MPNKLHLEAFHLARSRLIDEFADIEACLVALLARVGTHCAGELFGQKIELLRKAKPGPQFSKATKALSVDLMAQIEPYSALRADLVHARLQVALIDDQEFACFVNARCADDQVISARLLSAEQFHRLNQSVAKLAKQLAELGNLNPPVSPPPPSQAAKAGP